MVPEGVGFSGLRFPYNSLWIYIKNNKKITAEGSGSSGVLFLAVPC
jgi:hypothetical protein